MAVKGQAQRGRSGEFPPDKKVQAVLVLRPGDPMREVFADLVRTEGTSGAEVLRRAVEMYAARRKGSPANLQEAS
ncbi:hypothetical protein [Streptomyces sp. NPDC002913]